MEKRKNCMFLCFNVKTSFRKHNQREKDELEAKKLRPPYCMFFYTSQRLKFWSTTHPPLISICEVQNQPLFYVAKWVGEYIFLNRLNIYCFAKDVGGNKCQYNECTGCSLIIVFLRRF